MIQAVFIPHSQREEQGPAQKIKRLYWRFSWKNSSTGSLVLVLRQRTVGALKGVTKTVADQVAPAPPHPALWIPSCENLHQRLPLVYMDGWASPRFYWGLPACLPPSLRLTPDFPDSSKHPSNSLTLCLLLVHTVFESIISSRKRLWARRSGNTQTPHLFPIVLWSRSCDVVAVETVRDTAVWEQITSYIPCFLHIPLNKHQGHGGRGIGGSVTWASTMRAEGYTWSLGSALEPVLQSSLCTFTQRDSYPRRNLGRPFDNLHSECHKIIWPIYAKNVFPQNGRAVFSWSSLVHRKSHLWIY